MDATRLNTFRMAGVMNVQDWQTTDTGTGRG